MYFVYAHFKANDLSGLPFYIGKGKNKRDLSHNRNAHWKNIVSKYGFISIKIAEHLTEQEAWNLETVLIKKYGKLTEGTGCLCNIADGGEGASGTIHSDDTKAKWSSAKKGKTWEEIYGVEQALQMKEQRKNVVRPPHSEETKKKLSEAKKGEKNPMFGKQHSEDTKKKLSQAKVGKASNAKGKKYSEKTRQNYKKAAIIIDADIAIKEKISKSLTGIKRSDETKRKMAEAAIIREAKKKLLNN
jgi:hypothetical protein